MEEEKKWKSSAFARFFLWCSGARLYILKKCPTETNMFLGIGVVVFMTGVMAVISGGYAFYMVFKNIWLAITFGFLWGTLIFFLDWYLVSSLKKEKKWFKEIGMAFPRIILSVFIAVVVARPIEMKLFEKEIDLQVQREQLNERETQRGQISRQFTEIDTYKAENDSLMRLVNHARSRRDKLFNMMIAEAEGRSPVGIIGKGPVYKEKQNEYQIANNELKDIEARVFPVVEQNRELMKEIMAQKNALMTENQIIITRANGFLSRLKALNSLQENEASVGLASLFILLLFIAIESSPVFVKLISNRGPYDDLLFEYQALVSLKSRENVEVSKKTYLVSVEKSRKEREVAVDQIKKVNDAALEELIMAKNEINKDRIERWKEYQIKMNGETVHSDVPVLMDMEVPKDFDKGKKI